MRFLWLCSLWPGIEELPLTDPKVAGVDRRSAVRAFRDTAALVAALVSFLLELEELLPEEVGSMSLSPRKASRHLHLQHRRLEPEEEVAAADPATEDETVAPMDTALLLRLRQQLFVELFLVAVFRKKCNL